MMPEEVAGAVLINHGGSSLAARYYIAQLLHEGHSFNRLATELSDFDRVEPEELLPAFRGGNTALSGIISVLEAARAEIIPGLAAFSAPGGAVEGDAYQALRASILAGIIETNPTGIILDLHGAMLVDGNSDPEGDLLGAIRETVGRAVPIGVALDPHAHVTDEMLAHASFLTAYKNTPHTDAAEAGARAAQAVISMVHGTAQPVKAVVRVPMLTQGSCETANGPLKDLLQQSSALLKKHPELLDISLFNVQPFIDAPGVAQVVVATSKEPAGLEIAREAASSVAEAYWQARDRFRDDWPSFSWLLERLEERSPGDKPLIVGDFGDRVAAGGPGDSTFIARQIIESSSEFRALVPITDPVSVEQCELAGVGAMIELTIGGRHSGSPGLTLTFEVESIGPSAFVCDGPVLAGIPMSAGRSAVVRAGSLTVLLTERPLASIDPAAYTVHGLTLPGFDLIVVRSGYHFKSNFARHGRCEVIETPGITSNSIRRLPFKHAGNVFPFAAPTFSSEAVKVFT